jgi:hypothetical protein
MSPVGSSKNSSQSLSAKPHPQSYKSAPPQSLSQNGYGYHVFTTNAPATVVQYRFFLNKKQTIYIIDIIVLIELIDLI